MSALAAPHARRSRARTRRPLGRRRRSRQRRRPTARPALQARAPPWLQMSGRQAAIQFRTTSAIQFRTT
eukprot:91288-Chlamydomonas_euryale.AAC.1